VLKQISEAVGLLAAVVGAVYLLGALVLTLRLQTNDLPTLPVLSNLPRELVISYGLTYAVVPWLLAAAVVALSWIVRQQAPSAIAGNRPVLWHWRRRVSLLFAIVTLNLLGVWLVLRELKGDFTWLDIVVLEVTVAVVTVLAFAIWRSLARRYRREWSAPVATSIAAALSGLVVMPAGIEVGARAPLPDAQMCAEGPTHFIGLLVGEAGDRVYIGENVGSRIVASPRSGELYIGPGARERLLCRAERAAVPTADELVAAAFRVSGCDGCFGNVLALRVSGRQPRFARADIEGRIGDTVELQATRFIFRRAGTTWQVVAMVPSERIGCDELARRTGISANVLGEDLGACVLRRP
jgi:hypothetical protein